MKHMLVLAAVSVALGSCASTGEVDPDDAQLAPEEAAAPAEEEEALDAPSRTGVVMPVDPATVTLWPEAYSGELLVLEVLPQGSTVKAGDVIARLDTRSLEEQVADAELALASARVEHDGLLEKNAIAVEAAASKLARAEAALDRARRAYEGYTTQEAAFQQRSDDLSRKGEQSRVEDQLDELAQLEAMYEADELTDATEEIVLKRSRRNLALTEERNSLQEDRRQYRVELSDRIQLESRKEDLERRTEELAHLVRTQAVEARTREDGEARSAATLKKKGQAFERLLRDLERMEVVAPNDGVLLHGSTKDYRAGGSPRPIEPGGRLTARAESFLIAEPDALAFSIDVPESALTDFPDGAAVVVQPVAGLGDGIAGTLSLSAYPTSTQGDESHFAGTVTIEGDGPALLFGTHVQVERTDAP